MISQNKYMAATIIEMAMHEYSNIAAVMRAALAYCTSSQTLPTPSNGRQQQGARRSTKYRSYTEYPCNIHLPKVRNNQVHDILQTRIQQILSPELHAEYAICHMLRETMMCMVVQKPYKNTPQAIDFCVQPRRSSLT